MFATTEEKRTSGCGGNSEREFQKLEVDNCLVEMSTVYRDNYFEGNDTHSGAILGVC